MAKATHMGSQGRPCSYPVSYNMTKKTGKTVHRTNKSNSKGAKKFNHG